MGIAKKGIRKPWGFFFSSLTVTEKRFSGGFQFSPFPLFFFHVLVNHSFSFHQTYLRTVEYMVGSLLIKLIPSLEPKS